MVTLTLPINAARTKIIDSIQDAETMLAFQAFLRHDLETLFYRLIAGHAVRE